MDQFLKSLNLLKFTQEEIADMNRPISVKEIESVINNLPKQKAPDTDGFPGEFCQTFKEDVMPVLYSFFHRIEAN